MQEIVDAVNQYGVPTVVAVGMAYFIFFIWKFVTQEILPTLGKATGTLIGLIDRIRMLDNDMIRLDQKINTIIEIQNQQSDPFDERTKDKKRDVGGSKVYRPSTPSPPTAASEPRRRRQRWVHRVR